MIGGTSLELLRDECLTALDKYSHEAQKTCALLGAQEDNSDPLERLLAIQAQTQVEDQAAYLLLRQQLFEVLGEFEVW
jgi:hypothetical protein